MLFIILMLVEQVLLTLPQQLHSTPDFSVVRVTRSLVLCVMFCRSLFVLFSFGHCVVYPSSTYGFRLPLWYLQTLLNGFFSFLHRWPECQTIQLATVRKWFTARQNGNRRTTLFQTTFSRSWRKSISSSTSLSQWIFWWRRLWVYWLKKETVYICQTLINHCVNISKYFVMERKFKQWCSSIPLISTK